MTSCGIPLRRQHVGHLDRLMRDDPKHCACSAYNPAPACEFLQDCGDDIGVVLWDSRLVEGMLIR
jgi:hypothetical protein